MAIKLATTYKGIPLNEAYHRIISIISDRDQGTVCVRYGIWQNEAASMVVEPSREALDQAEAELHVFIATRTDEDNYQTGLDYRTRRVDELQRAFREGTTTVAPVLEHLAKAFPYAPDATVAKGYLLLKTLPEFAGAVDV